MRVQFLPSNSFCVAPVLHTARFCTPQDIASVTVLKLEKKGSVRCLLISILNLFVSSSRFCAGLAVFLIELFNTASGIHNFLCARIKRMTLRTDLDAQGLDRGGSRSELVATTASNGNLAVVWMDFSFHFSSLLKDGAVCRTPVSLRIIH